jgi:hypothetical protein
MAQTKDRVGNIAAERWPSGLRRRFAKPLYGQKLYPGFESLPLRQTFLDEGSLNLVESQWQDEHERLDPVDCQWPWLWSVGAFSDYGAIRRATAIPKDSADGLMVMPGVAPVVDCWYAAYWDPPAVSGAARIWMKPLAGLSVLGLGPTSHKPKRMSVFPLVTVKAPAEGVVDEEVNWFVESTKPVDAIELMSITRQ